MTKLSTRFYLIHDPIFEQLNVWLNELYLIKRTWADTICILKLLLDIKTDCLTNIRLRYHDNREIYKNILSRVYGKSKFVPREQVPLFLYLKVLY